MEEEYCNMCGAHLEEREIELYEDTCQLCIEEVTGGLINDQPGSEL